jgi:hypothetical protein
MHPAYCPECNGEKDAEGWCPNYCMDEPKECYIHKYQVSLEYGGREEGDWWYDSGTPTGFTLGPIQDEEDAFAQCRKLNELERERREREETYEYTSVLAHLSNHFSYSVEDSAIPEPYPQERPHYE